jgi:hypothetical protein
MIFEKEAGSAARLRRIFGGSGLSAMFFSALFYLYARRQNMTGTAYSSFEGIELSILTRDLIRCTYFS